MTLNVPELNVLEQHLAESYHSLLTAVDGDLEPLLCCYTRRLYLTLRPAAQVLYWNMPQQSWNNFFSQCRKALDDYQKLCVRLQDLHKNRVRDVLDSLACFTVCPPECATVTLNQFTHSIREECRRAAREMQQRNILLEDGVNQLAELVAHPCNDPERFFRTGTECIADQLDPVKVPRSGRKRATSRTCKSSPARLSRCSSNAEDNPPEISKNSTGSASSLPPLSSVAAAKEADPPVKDQSVKLPRIVAKFEQGSTKQPQGSKERPATCLPPLTGSSGTSATEAKDEKQLLSDYSHLIHKTQQGIANWKRQCSKKLFQVLVTWLKTQLDQLRHLVAPSDALIRCTDQADVSHRPLFQLTANYRGPFKIDVSPSLDEVQEAVNASGREVMAVTKNITKWSGRKVAASSVSQNMYTVVSEHKDVIKAMNRLVTCLTKTKNVSQQLSHFGVEWSTLNIPWGVLNLFDNVQIWWVGGSQQPLSLVKVRTSRINF